MFLRCRACPGTDEPLRCSAPAVPLCREFRDDGGSLCRESAGLQLGRLLGERGRQQRGHGREERERCGAAGGAADGVRRICPPFRNGAPRSAARRFISDHSDGTYSGRFGAVAGGDFHAGRGALPALCAGTVRLFFAGTFRAYRRRSYRYQSDERHHQCFRARCPADDTE